jgi:hypothetical protein
MTQLSDSDRQQRCKNPTVEARASARWWRDVGRGQLSLLLWALWDPIDAGLPIDEYENYSDRLFSLLERDASPEQLADELEAIRTGMMGQSAERRADLRVAEKLREWHSWARQDPRV